MNDSIYNKNFIDENREKVADIRKVFTDNMKTVINTISTAIQNESENQ